MLLVYVRNFYYDGIVWMVLIFFCKLVMNILVVLVFRGDFWRYAVELNIGKKSKVKLRTKNRDFSVYRNFDGRRCNTLLHHGFNFYGLSLHDLKRRKGNF